MTAATPSANAAPTFDCLVLSGGGAKGAYGAGAAKAVLAYRKLRGIEGPVCFIGTSAGALNAAVLATSGPDALIAMWKRVRNHDVLGTAVSDWRLNALRGKLRRSIAGSPHFSVYSNDALRSLIGRNVDFSKLADAHLIVCATDFTHGRMRSFFASKLVARMLASDEGRRLSHFVTIRDQADLIEVLLASSSIPVAFPPVELRGAWFVDGGIGNHTPTREAAYFLRHVPRLDAGSAGVTYCIRQDPLSAVDSGSATLDVKRYVMRTIDVYHHIHTDPIVAAWRRISEEVDEQSTKLAALHRWLEQQRLPKDVKRSLARRVAELARLGGNARRISTPLIEIQPGADLGDPLDFKAARILDSLRRGWSEALLRLQTLDATARRICGRLKVRAVDEPMP
ncbi:MAG: patatin-like phospholipase family protein [Planctomycetes bacterium]|nr:patatin-like phospholipase family protein [Planctomycetota bacterium]